MSDRSGSRTRRGAGRAAGSGASRGFAAVLIIVYGVFALSATARSLVQILRHGEQAPLAYTLSLGSALTYIAVTAALVRRGPRSGAALVLCLIELVGVLGVGSLTVLAPGLFGDETVWTHFGQGYGFVPLVLPLVALVYMLRARRTGPPAPSGPGERLA